MSSRIPWKPSNAQALRLLSDPRRVVPIVGAGLSIPAGLPSGEDLARYLAAGPLAEGATLDRDDHLSSVVTALSQIHGHLRVQETISHRIQQAGDVAAIPTTLRSLVKTPSRWVLTFNYDLLIERAAAAEGIEHVTITHRDRLAPLLEQVREPQRLIVLHLHGAVTDPSSVVADTGSYNQVTSNEALDRLLTVLLYEHHGCFLGTRLDEPYLQVLLQFLSEVSQPKHVLIGQDKDVRSIREADRGAITPSAHAMEFDAFPDGDWQCLEEFCAWLVSRQPVATAPLVDTAGASSSPISGDARDKATIVRFLNPDWGPAWTHKAQRELGEHAPAELAALRDALDAGETAETLICGEPAWLRQGSWRLWIAVARFAEEHGNWDASSAAWQRASQVEGSDAARCLVAAAIAAGVGNRSDDETRLLDAARAIDDRHPRLLLQDAAKTDDPREQLKLLEPLFASENEIAALARCHATVASLLLGDFESAAANLDQAERLAPELLQTQLSRVNFTVHSQRHELTSGRRVDAVALQGAREDALALREELMPFGRYAESVRTLMLAADATALLGDFAGASAMLRTASPQELDSNSGRLVLADCALRAHDGSTALSLLATVDDTAAVRAMRAQARIDGPDADARERARHDLLTLVENPDVAERAALVLVTRADRFPDEPFPEPAEAWCLSHGESRAAVVGRAMWGHRRGAPAEARSLVQAHEPEPWAHEIGLQLAIWDEDTDAVLHFVDRLLGEAIDTGTRVLCARKLAESGRVDRAREVAAAVAQDSTVPPLDRADAFQVVCHALIDRAGDYQSGLQWLSEWAKVVPNDSRHVWGRIAAHLQLAQAREALALLDSSGVAVETMDQARLAAQCFTDLDDRVEGLRRLADLIDALPEADEDFVQRAWLLLLTSGDVELPADVVERLRPADTTFLDRHAITIEQMMDLLRDRQQSIAEVEAELLAGEAATTKLAQAAGRDVTSSWLLMRPKPSGFGSPDLHLAEVNDAARALTYGAVVDATGLVTLTDLPESVRSVALQKLLAPLRLANSTLADVHQGCSSGAGTGQVLAWDAESEQPMAIEEDQTVLDERQRRLNEVLDLAQNQVVEPDVADGRPTPFDAHVDPQAPAGARALLASFALSHRTGRPVFSEDRSARLLARRFGLPAFGVLALLEALRTNNAISDDDGFLATNTLRDLGYCGTNALAGEVLYWVRRGDKAAVQRIVSDVLTWRSTPGAQFASVVRYLRESWTQAHESLQNRLADVLDWVEAVGVYKTLLRDHAWPVRTKVFAQLVVMASMSTDAQFSPHDGFLADLCNAADRLVAERRLGRRGEVVLGALEWIRSYDRALADSLTLFIRLPLWHQATILGVDFGTRRRWREELLKFARPTVESIGFAGQRPRRSRRTRRKR